MVSASPWMMFCTSTCAATPYKSTFIELKIFSKYFQHICAAFCNVVFQQFNTIDAHQPQQCEIPPLKIRLAVFHFHSSELRRRI